MVPPMDERIWRESTPLVPKGWSIVNLTKVQGATDAAPGDTAADALRDYSG